jgi:uncharacterized membrane protein YjjB (DUF3815 family)
MGKLLGFVGATIGSYVGWYLGKGMGTMTAFFASTVVAGVGLYLGRRAGKEMVA